MGAARRGGAVLLAGRARPAALRLPRPVRGAERGGGGDGPHPPGDDDRDRPAAPRGDAAQAGRLRAGAVRRAAHARPGRRRAPRRLRGGRGAAPRPRRAAVRPARASCTTGATRRSCRRSRASSRRELLVGGGAGAAFARMARYADGFAHGGGPPRAFASAATKARAAWSDLGRPGTPALWGQAYFALGDEAAGEAYLLDYYAFTGPFAAKVAAGTLTSAARAARLRARLRGGGLRRAGPAADRRRPRPAGPAGRARWRERSRSSGPARPASTSRSCSARRPAHEVVVIERNPPGATFGFGVVFSEETLGRLRDADEPTYEEITEAFATWTTIDVRYRGEVIRSRGHSFSAIRRTALLDILQRRARELGVELPLRAGGRRDRASCPRPTCWSAPTASTRWCGARTRRSCARACALPDALRLVRHRPRAGRVHVRLRRHRARALPGARLSVRRRHEHVHRRDARGHVAARRARRARRGESRWRSAQELFADTLQGHPLLSNRSVWLAFNEVRCAHWSTARPC